jgi:hypothetical protein
MDNLKIKRKVYEIILGEMGNFIRLEEITKPISTKYLSFGKDEISKDGYSITLYYIKENEYTYRMLYKDQLLFSDIIE